MTDRRPHCIVVTGASAGIDQALARTYAAPGVTLGLVARDAVRLKARAEQCRRAGTTTITAQLDIRDTRAVAAWLTAFDNTHPLDLLIVNASVANTLSSVNDWESLARIREVFDTNSCGTFHTLLPMLVCPHAHERGHVAMISSLTTIRDMTISSAYYAGKSAVRAYGESMQPLLVVDGALSPLVLPGFIKTTISNIFPDDKPLLWSTNKAARHIRAKLDVRRTEITFPALLALGMRLLPLLSPRPGDRILDRLSYLPRAGR